MDHRLRDGLHELGRGQALFDLDLLEAGVQGLRVDRGILLGLWMLRAVDHVVDRVDLVDRGVYLFEVLLVDL